MRIEEKTAGRTFTLTFDEKEAEVLKTIMSQVGGAPEGPRGVADSLYDSLDSFGVKSSHGTMGEVRLSDSWEHFNQRKE